MEILPVNDLDIALHNFVNKDDKMAFYTCVHNNIEETRVSFFMAFILCMLVCDTDMLEYIVHAIFHTLFTKNEYIVSSSYYCMCYVNVIFLPLPVMTNSYACAE